MNFPDDLVAYTEACGVLPWTCSEHMGMWKVMTREDLRFSPRFLTLEEYFTKRCESGRRHDMFLDMRTRLLETKGVQRTIGDYVNKTGMRVFVRSTAINFDYTIARWRALRQPSDRYIKHTVIMFKSRAADAVVPLLCAARTFHLPLMLVEGLFAALGNHISVSDVGEQFKNVNKDSCYCARTVARDMK